MAGDDFRPSLSSSTGAPAPAPARLSIVLPCYNEARGLAQLVARYAQAGAGVDFELILVDNGSRDDTAEVLNDLAAQHPFIRALTIQQNQGYGHGIMTGLRAARSEVVAWSHADLQTDPADVFRALEVYRQAPDPQRLLVKGRRMGRGLSEKAFSTGMQSVATLLLRTPLHEINAQPKLFHRSLLDRLTEPPPDFSFDLYVLWRAKRCGWKIESIPVQFPPRPHGVSNWSATFRSRLKTTGRAVRYMLRLGFGGAAGTDRSAESTALLVFFALEPEAAFGNEVLRYKRLTQSLAGPQEFLDHPPHLTLYVGMFPLAARSLVLETAAAWAARHAAPRATLRGWQVFRDDPFTGGHTIVCKPAEGDADRLRRMQRDLIEVVAPLRDGAASEARVRARWVSFSQSQRDATVRFGFPFIGEGWRPHVSIASIRPEDWGKVWPTLEADPPNASVEFPSLGVYGHDSAGQPVLISRFDLAASSLPA